MLIHEVTEKQGKFSDVTGERNKSNVNWLRAAHQFNTSICLSSVSLASPVAMSYGNDIFPCWGARSKALVQISAEKLSARKKECRRTGCWDDFYRNRGIYLPFLHLSFGSAITSLWGCSVSYSYEVKLYPEQLLKIDFCSLILFWNREFWHLKCWFPLPWPWKAVWGRLLAKSYGLGQWNQWKFL